jgi:hypothetical protein
MLSAEIIKHSHLLYHSFEQATGQKLLAGAFQATPHLAEALYGAPFALLSHGTEPDPIFNYANLTAQKLWELPWEQFTAMPSRLSAEPVLQAERQRMMEQARSQGFISHYEGIRISSTGKRFMIKNAMLWNVYDESRGYQGQAALFHEWTFI